MAPGLVLVQADWLGKLEPSTNAPLLCCCTYVLVEQDGSLLEPSANEPEVPCTDVFSVLVEGLGQEESLLEPSTNVPELPCTDVSVPVDGLGQDDDSLPESSTNASKVFCPDVAVLVAVLLSPNKSLVESCTAVLLGVRVNSSCTGGILVIWYSMNIFTTVLMIQGVIPCRDTRDF